MLQIAGHEIRVVLLSRFHQYRVEHDILLIGKVLLEHVGCNIHCPQLQILQKYVHGLRIEMKLRAMKHILILPDDFIVHDGDDISDQRFHRYLTGD